jgi:hypothetical protein
MAMLLLSATTLLAGPTAGETPPTGMKNEPGGEVYVGTDANATNPNGTIFWTGNCWATAPYAAHLYLCDQNTGKRLRDYATVANLKAGDPALLFREGNLSITAKDYEYIERSPSGTKYTFRAMEYDISWGGWRAILMSRGNGGSQAEFYFILYVQDPLNRTLCLTEGISCHALNLTLSAAVKENLSPLAPLFGLPAAGSRYWLDIGDGSDMGGQSFQLVTESRNLSLIGKGGSATVISRLELKYTNSSGGLNRIVMAPMVHGYGGDTGKPSVISGTTPVILACAAVLAALVAGKRRRWHLDASSATEKNKP